mmetsp:Transcript_37679/g.80481  ORF Transcript_37679/g.80481 Transcript_37679/m.80481 type:complete len:218 (+) Transcript_37679:149-802(+)
MSTEQENLTLTYSCHILCANASPPLLRYLFPPTLIHLIQWAIETPLPIHVLSVFSPLILRCCPPRRSGLIIRHSLPLGRIKSSKPHHPHHFILIVADLLVIVALFLLARARLWRWHVSLCGTPVAIFFGTVRRGGQIPPLLRLVVGAHASHAIPSLAFPLFFILLPPAIPAESGVVPSPASKIGSVSVTVPLIIMAAAATRTWTTAATPAAAFSIHG